MSDLRHVLLYALAQFVGMVVISAVAVAWAGSGERTVPVVIGVCLVGLLAMGLERVREWLAPRGSDDGEA